MDSALQVVSRNEKFRFLKVRRCGLVRRILLGLAVAALMVSIVIGSALPATAQGDCGPEQRDYYLNADGTWWYYWLYRWCYEGPNNGWVQVWDNWYWDGPA